MFNGVPVKYVYMVPCFLTFGDENMYFYTQKETIYKILCVIPRFH